MYSSWLWLRILVVHSQVFCFHEICNMTQKFHDFTYHAFSYDTEMIVVCPIAKQASNVQYDPIQKSAYFKCNGCYTHKKILPDADWNETTGRCSSKTTIWRRSVFPLSTLQSNEFSWKHRMGMNKAHLQYLIDNISVKIQTVDADFHRTNKTIRSQSDWLPTFMKTAKNREDLLKVLKKSQKK